MADPGRGQGYFGKFGSGLPFGKNKGQPPSRNWDLKIVNIRKTKYFTIRHGPFDFRGGLGFFEKKMALIFAQVLGSGIFFFFWKITYKFILHTYEALCGSILICPVIGIYSGE